MNQMYLNEQQAVAETLKGMNAAAREAAAPVMFGFLAGFQAGYEASEANHREEKQAG